MTDEEFETAVDAVDAAFQKVDASIETALNAMGYLTSLTISGFPEDEQEEVLDMIITSLRKNIEMMSNKPRGRILQ